MIDMMVERVARALCFASGQDPDFNYDPRGVRRADDVRWRMYLPKARAAIEAMREPTREMVSAVQDRAECFSFGAELLDSDIRSILALAIDGALK